MAYRLIGTGTTNAQGVAICSNNYVGTGKGEVDFIASTDNPIVEGSLQSVPSSVIDGIFRDGGTSSDHNDSWTNVSSNIDRTRAESYTTLTRKADSSSFGYLSL
jgi:hypothetical protein